MKKALALVFAVLGLGLILVAQTPASTATPLTAAELKSLVPSNVFFAGQTAPTQLRNSAGLRGPGGKLLLVFLVDTSGYASDVAQQYQGYLLTESAISIEGQKLQPGAYGVGFTADGTFHVMDVGAHDVAAAPAHTDAQLHRPVPLAIRKSGATCRIYFGRRYVQVELLGK